MFRRILLAWLFIILVWAMPVVFGAAPAAPAVKTASLITARAGILMDRKTGLVLWSQNADLPLPMASTTKVMTAMVILDRGSERLSEKVRVSKYAGETGGSSQFAAGDVVTLGDLLKAALIRSSNESTVAAAEYLAGDEKTFVGWMNDKARDLGLTHTHFANPHGLYQPGRGPYHYSTARDMALIARHALTYYPLIRRIVTTKLDFAYADPPRGKVRLESRDKIVGHPVPGVPGSIVDGVKTGYVVESGKCLISSATLGDWQLIAVVLKSEDAFQDNLALLRYGFTRYAWKTYATDQRSGLSAPVSLGSPGAVPLGAKGDLGAPLPRLEFGGDAMDDQVVFLETHGRRLRAPVRAGMEVGVLQLMRNGRVIAEAPAVTLQAVKVTWWVWALLVVAGLFLLIALLTLVGIIYGTHTKNARRRRRLQQTARGGIDPGGTSLG